MMPSSPSATERTAAPSVTQENTISAAAATARGVSAKRMPGLDQRLGLVPAAVPAGDGVTGRHQPGHDAWPMTPSPTKSEVHSFHLVLATCPDAGTV